MTRTHSTPLHRFALLCLLALLATAVSVGIAGPASAGTTPSQDESRMLTLVNQERQARGLAPLVSDPAFADTSRSWSAYLASKGKLSHDPQLGSVATRIEPNWRLVAENVGYAGSVDRVHELLMNSTGHRNNILSSSTNRIGIGIVHSGGSTWVTQRFLQGPAISGPTGLETAGRAVDGPCAANGTVVAGDFDRDGDDDILVHGPSSAPDEVLAGSGSRRFSEAPTAINGSYIPISGDFTGAGSDSVLFYTPGSGADYLSHWNGSSFVSDKVRINGHYTPSVGDLDGDGRDDIIWYAPGSNADYIWYGTSTSGDFNSQQITVNGTYCLIVADLDGNGQDDLTWYAPGGAADYIHMRTGARSFTSIQSTVNGSYQPAAADFDGDGNDDIVWHAPGSAKDYIWYGESGFGNYRSVAMTVNGAYYPITGDFDADGNDDIVWTDGANADGMPVWFGQDRRGGFDDGRV